MKARFLSINYLRDGVEVSFRKGFWGKRVKIFVVLEREPRYGIDIDDQKRIDDAIEKELLKKG